MRCLYCGTEVWRTARIRRDPDFCSPDHREKYKNRIDLALQQVQEQPAPAAPSPVEPSYKDPGFIQLFGTPQAAAFTWRTPGWRAATGIAAAVIAISVLWSGKPAPNSATSLQNPPAAHAPASSNNAAVSAPAAFRHPVAWLQSAASKRAAWQFSETFDNGMAAWGAGSKGWAKGWTRSPAGYVHPGQLALFQPTVGYADYRMEFLGEIEKSGMSWVFRGKDTQNYYAMNLRILRPGLRPVLSMTHYPVVQGRPGRAVDQPLSVMIHNGMPYHVSVDVRGNHYTASIEGEQVDSWSDDTLPAGGVGFFSEASERARIYWVNVSENNDWLGWLCGRIAGRGGAYDSAGVGHPVPSILPAFVSIPALSHRTLD